MNKHRFGALLAAGVLTLTFAGTALGADPDYATVSGYADGSSDNNKAETWGENCTKIDDLSIDSWVTDADYSLVVVKGASGEKANTLFEDVAEGQTVWADTNGNGVFDPGGKDGDKQISHIIVCEPDTETETTETSTTETSTIETETTETETTETETTETETTDSVDSQTESKTPPATDAIAGTDGTVSGSLWALLVGAAGILAGVLLLTPRSIRNRR
jgi:hypothetical protein